MVKSLGAHRPPAANSVVEEQSDQGLHHLPFCHTATLRGCLYSQANFTMMMFWQFKNLGLLLSNFPILSVIFIRIDIRNCMRINYFNTCIYKMTGVWKFNLMFSA